MPNATDKDETQYNEAETERRREAALKRMLNTPHKPHAKRIKKRSKKAGITGKS
jgi:hypothetical protein